MDVGTGSGILAIFSAAAGARKVYAIEASSAIRYANVLVKQHNLEEKIILINKKIEEISQNELEPVDIIISEPLGVMLVNERMLESFLLARDKYIDIYIF
jgi:predicted RNA methylase